MEKTEVFRKQEEIKTLLKELNLQAENSPEPFIEKDKRFFYSPCLNAQGKKVFIKMVIKKEHGVIESLRREAIATKLIGQHTNIKIPKYCDSDFETEMPWFIHEYAIGEPMGFFYELKEKYKEQKFIDQALANLDALYKATQFLVETDIFFRNLKENNYNVYLKTFLGAQRRYGSDKILEINFEEIMNLLEKNKKFLQDKKNYVIAQGDFTLANNIVCNDGIYIIDWESLHINNFGDDIGRLWIQTWLYPKWRQKLLLTFLNNIAEDKQEIFKQIFRIVAISQAFSEIGGGSKMCDPKFSSGVIAASLETITRALKGFDSLLEQK